MAQKFQEILDIYTQGILDIYGTHLKSVILYGSYARGDNREDSDVDIMILVDLTEEAVQKSREQVSIYTFDFNMQYDTEIMPIVKEADHFRYWSKVSPFYKNIEEEGVALYAS